jgi:hypothetical protein
MGPVSEFLLRYLDSIDERLLDYLDEEGELRPDVVRRLRFYATALLDGSITPAAVDEDWPDWYDLAPSFVAAYCPDEIEDLQEEAAFMEGETSDAPLTEADRVYLRTLEPLLDMYPEMRATEGE